MLNYVGVFWVVALQLRTAFGVSEAPECTCVLMVLENLNI